jgi:hypothetical protein
MNTDEARVEDSLDSESTEYKLEVPVDGFQIATMRADRKKQVTISVKLFEGAPGDFREVGRLQFMRKDLPDDYVKNEDGNDVIIMNALVTDFERMMALVGGRWPVQLTYLGAEEKSGRAFLKSLRHVYPKREE